MDTTADAYLYAGVRMMGDFWKALDHQLVAAVVQVVLAGGLAWWLSERWQRWRQRREFQHQTLIKFSTLSAQVLTDLSHLLVARGKIDEAERRRLGIEALSRRSTLLAMDAELFGLFDDEGQLYADMVELKNAARDLNQMAFAASPVPQSTFQPVQERFTLRRRLMITKILAEMKFITREERTAILASLAAPGRVDLAAE